MNMIAVASVFTAEFILQLPQTPQSVSMSVSQIHTGISCGGGLAR